MSNGWSEYQRLVLAELERLDENDRKISDQILALSKDMATLKVKAGMFGAIAGSIPALVGILWWLLQQG